MKDIYEYITLPKSERQKHLDLNEKCIERGAGSYYFKGLLAHFLDTSVPTGAKIHLCHACNNGACSNPKHLYWGTAQENRNDQVTKGTDKSIWTRTVEKYGLEKATEMVRRAGNTNGSGNKGKPKSEEHKRKIAENHKGGRKKKV